MPQFSYRARTKGGELKTGHIEAETAGAVAAHLAAQDFIPISIVAGTAGQSNFNQSIELDFSKIFKPKIGLADLILFARQMFTLAKAGVPLNRAIAVLRESSRNRTMQTALEDIQDSLDQGKALSAALEKHPKIFSSLIVSLVQVGENTGRLDQIFNEIADYLEREQETIRRIKSALRYPAMVLIAITVAVVVINIWVIPPFADLFARYDAELPLPTKIIIGSSNFMIAYWPYMLVGCVGLIMLLRMYVNTAWGHYNWDYLKLKIPKIGGVINRAILARFSGTFAMLLRSGVPLIHGLTVTSYAVDNEYLGRHIRDMREDLEKGESLAQTAKNTGLFDSLVVQMISIGEETGSVDELLEEVSGHYDRDVDYDLKTLSDAIEPMLIVMIGVIVLILALGVFLPLWRLGSVLGG